MLYKGLGPDTHRRLSLILRGRIVLNNYVAESSLALVPSHAEETIVRDITLITAALKDLEAAKYVQNFSAITTSVLYTNTDVIGVEAAGALKKYHCCRSRLPCGLSYG